MGSENMDEIRARKQKELLEAMYRDQKIKEGLMKILEGDAYERMMNIKQVDPERYNQIALLLIQLANNGQIKGKINDAQLRQILARLTNRREPKIEIRRK